jgi:hypothetical protein
LKPFTLPIKEHLAKGLAPNSNPRNNPMLTESIGAVPYEKTLQALDVFSAIDTSSLTCSWPYPQLFVFSEVIIVCNNEDIYEYIVGTGLVHRCGPVTPGVPWVAEDFKTYIYLTNGHVAVTWKEGVWALDTTVPFGSAICNYAGQALLGGPNNPFSGVAGDKILLDQGGAVLIDQGGNLVQE